MTIRQLRLVEKQMSFGAVSEAHSHLMLMAMSFPLVPRLPATVSEKTVSATLVTVSAPEIFEIW